MLFLWYNVGSPINTVIQLRRHQQTALDAMLNEHKGQVIMPTGAGKTLCMIEDTKIHFGLFERQTHVIVAPRLLLAQQLCSEFLEHIVDPMVRVMRVHSGYNTNLLQESTTNPKVIYDWAVQCYKRNKLIFTTYHSLHRVVESGIKIDTIYFDEAHNSVKRNFFPATEHFRNEADRCFFFTATPKHTRKSNRGMNNGESYGKVLCNVPAPELIKGGSILPPTVVPYEVDFERQKGAAAAVNDRDMLLGVVDSLDAASASKVLVASPASKVMGAMLFKTDIMHQLKERGYDVLHITSKYGAYVNQTKVNREHVFDTFDAWGKDPNKKFIIFHYSILSEGINVHGLTHTVMLRQLDIIEMAQTIGRVIRLDRDDAADIASGRIKPGVLHNYRKRTGFVTVPVYANHGKGIAKRLQSVVDCIFVKGVPAVSIH